ncbi:MAG: hypothetical protein WAV51_02205 [Microgenomates group bacterium]
MKKSLLVLLSLFLVTPIIAAQNSSVSQGMNTTTKPVTTVGVVPSTGNKVQNAVQTQNQGEDSQLQISTEEKLGTEAGNSMDTRSENAKQNMSEVAKQVQGMLEIRTTGGIGDQVREVAREQNQAQEKIQEHVMKMEAKNQMLKKLFGPDYKSLTSLTQLIEENTVRIEQLQELLIQVQNYADRTQIEEAIQSIVSQNTALNSLIQEEAQTRSMFGWLMRLFNQ